MLVGALGACTTRMAEPPLPQQTIVQPPEITVDPDTGEHSLYLSVLIYNIAALPWPIKANRTRAIRLIGAELAAMRTRGEEPDIVMIQEGFRRSVKELIRASGYPNWVRGPKTGDTMPKYSERAPEAFRSESYFWKGERLGKIMDSGLYILSNWPIVAKGTQAFYRHECAGFDCGANKGILSADIAVPGMPGTLQLYTTHLNSRGSTGVPEARSLIAHTLQIDHLDEYFDARWDREQPVIFGGDFNMKSARDRLDYAVGRHSVLTDTPVFIVQHYCTVLVRDCDVRMSYDSDEPWLDTNDLQGWVPGRYVHVRAVEVDAWFDTPYPGAPKIRGRTTLSDHDGLFVRYRLSWTPQAPAAKKESRARTVE